MASTNQGPGTHWARTAVSACSTHGNSNPPRQLGTLDQSNCCHERLTCRCASSRQIFDFTERGAANPTSQLSSCSRAVRLNLPFHKSLFPPSLLGFFTPSAVDSHSPYDLDFRVRALERFTNADLGSGIWLLGFWLLGFGILGEGAHPGPPCSLWVPIRRPSAATAAPTAPTTARRSSTASVRPLPLCAGTSATLDGSRPATCENNTSCTLCVAHWQRSRRSDDGAVTNYDWPAFACAPACAPQCRRSWGAATGRHPGITDTDTYPDLGAGMAPTLAAALA
jgi:hypothetical protein